MKNKLLLMVVVVLSVILLGIVVNKKEQKIEHKKEENLINVKNKDTEEVEQKDLEEYVLGVVAAEMPASFSYEALKAQAIAARTYAVYKMKNTKEEYDVIADVSNQAYITEEQMKEKWQQEFSTYYEKIKKAVKETEKEIMYYNGEVIESFYFAMSNGKTENVSAVFGESLPYLISVESKWDNETIKNYEVNTQLSTAEFCNKLNISCNSIVINNQIYDDTGRTKEITINEKQFSGTDVRKLLGLRSTDFTIEINGEIINIKTKGYGHGVGMSQYGANGMAKEGYDCYEILKYYYKDIEIKKM